MFRHCPCRTHRDEQLPCRALFPQLHPHLSLLCRQSRLWHQPPYWRLIWGRSPATSRGRSRRGGLPLSLGLMGHDPPQLRLHCNRWNQSPHPLDRRLFPRDCQPAMIACLRLWPAFLVRLSCWAKPFRVECWTLPPVDPRKFRAMRPHPIDCHILRMWPRLTLTPTQIIKTRHKIPSLPRCSGLAQRAILL